MERKSIQSLSFQNLNFQTTEDHLIFRDLSIDFPLNKIVWLKGTSGSGKSILLRILAGLILPTSGKYLLNGEEVSEMTFEEFLPYRCNIGYSFDFGGLISNRDVMGNLLMAYEYHDLQIGRPSEFVSRVFEYMSIFNLQHVAYKRPSAIIGGLRKATCVARAFVHEPEMILLDDPTTGLRGETTKKLKDLIQMKRANGTLKHAIIASDDEEFMQSLHPLTIEIDNKNRKLQMENAA